MKKSKIICMAFMDPICTYCYGTDPELKKFEWLYKAYVDVRYYIGGLLTSWDIYKEAGGMIAQPEDMYAHWMEIGAELGIGINPSVWHTNPIQSSEPPSIFYRAVTLIDPKKGQVFLRKIKEALFMEGQKIDDPYFLMEICKDIGCNSDEVQKILDDDSAKRIFQHERVIASSFDVQLFPTLIITDQTKMVRLEGSTSYEAFVHGLRIIDPTIPEISKRVSLEQFLNQYDQFTMQEMAVVLGISLAECKETIEKLKTENKIESHKNDFLEYYKKISNKTI